MGQSRPVLLARRAVYRRRIDSDRVFVQGDGVMDKTAGQFARLPKWAQTEIQRLTANERYAKAAIEGLGQGEGITVRVGGTEATFSIDANIDIPTNHGYPLTMRINKEDNRLRISTNRGTIIYPVSGNVIEIDLEHTSW